MTTMHDLVRQLRDALATALERYGMIDPDYHPGENEDDSESDEDDPIHTEAEEIEAALKAADAFLAEQVTEIKLSRPLFRLHQWPLRTLIHGVPGRVTIVGEPLSVDPRDQLSLAAAVLRGWPVVVTLRRLAGGAYRPLDQRSARVLGALMALTNPYLCAVYLVQDSMGAALTLEPNDLTLATILDHKGRWEAGRALEAAGHDGQANRLEHLANTWSDFHLTVHEVLDLPAADEIATWMDRST